MESEAVVVGMSDCEVLSSYGVTRFRMDVSPDSPVLKKYGKRIKEIDGDYSECRGYTNTRFLHFPLTLAGVALASEIASDSEVRPDYKGRKTEKYCIVLEGPSVPVETVYEAKRPDAVVAKAYATLKAKLASGEIETHEAKKVRLEKERIENLKRRYETLKVALAETEAAMKAEGLL